MRTIYKYTLKVTDQQSIPMIAGAEILCVQVQGDYVGTVKQSPLVWHVFEVDKP